MKKKRKELQINNSFQILKEFCPRLPSYMAPKKSNYPEFNQPGKVKVFTPEEIILYRMKQTKLTTYGGN